MSTTKTINSKNQKHYNSWLKLLQHFAVLMFLYTICRVCFFCFNTAHFSNIGFAQYRQIAWKALYFDWSAICSINIFFATIYSFPIKHSRRSWYPTFLRYLFLIPNFIALLFEMSDWIYFEYNHQRATAEVLSLIFQKGDFINLLPSFIKAYWWLFLAAFVLFGVQKKVYLCIENKPSRFTSISFTTSIVIWVVSFGICIIGIRGGFQLKPLNIRDAILYTDNKHVPLLLNTPFSIIATFQNDNMQVVHFMDTPQAIALTQPIKSWKSEQAFVRKNIVIIILESFSKEFTALGGGLSYTPFLDSLMQQSLIFDRAYANALHSAQGIPAILAGIPGILPQAFSMSPYANNQINSFASLLKPLGYQSTFYHGGTNGSMSFDVFTKNAGYDRYLGRTEYNNEKDYDGTWGIWDVPFMQFTAQDLTKQPQPFHAALFNINSHHPYHIPSQYDNQIPKTSLPIQRAVAYADIALAEFFKTISKTDWYHNTLFIITADHASAIGTTPYHQDMLGKFEIPIIYFDPQKQLVNPKVNHTLTQQIDILPTTLALLHYKDPFYALGNNILDSTTTPFVLTKQGALYTFIHPSIRLQITDTILTAAFAFPQDSLDLSNIMHQSIYQQATDTALWHFKAIMQVFTNDLIDNRMYSILKN